MPLCCESVRLVGLVSRPKCVAFSTLVMLKYGTTFLKAGLHFVIFASAAPPHLEATDLGYRLWGRASL